MDRIENLRKQYYESIRLLQKEQDILNALPQPEYENFFTLISGVIKMLDDMPAQQTAAHPYKGQVIDVQV